MQPPHAAGARARGVRGRAAGCGHGARGPDAESAPHCLPLRRACSRACNRGPAAHVCMCAHECLGLERFRTGNQAGVRHSRAGRTWRAEIRRRLHAGHPALSLISSVRAHCPILPRFRQRGANAPT
eukprot:356093-Chlamydomonas_euryale.AAC.4